MHRALFNFCVGFLAEGTELSRLWLEKFLNTEEEVVQIMRNAEENDNLLLENLDFG